MQGRTAVTREHKLALIVGFSLVLLLGVLISDHLSKAKHDPLAVEVRENNASAFGGGPSGLASANSGAPGQSKVLPSSEVQIAAQRPLTPLPGALNVSDQGATTQGATTQGATADRGHAPVASPTPVKTEFTMGNTRQGQKGTGLGVGGLTPIAQVDATSAADSGLPITKGQLQRHDVREGDTLYALAQKYYNDSSVWQKLRDYNKGKASESGMRVGVTLLIPPKDVLQGAARLADARVGQFASGSSPVTGATPITGVTPVSPSLGSTAGPITPVPNAKPAEAKGYATYTVKSGDSLAEIARKQLGSARRVSDIIEANKGTLDNPDELKVGMTLRLPSASSSIR